MPCVDCAQDIETQDGHLVCDDCASELHSRCEGCREWHLTDWPCTDCVRCDWCREPIRVEDTVQTTRDATICDDCRRYYCWRCDECDGWNRDGTSCANGCCDPETCDCDDCRDLDSDNDQDADVGRLIHGYLYKPSPVFHGTGPLFLGPEIEVETLVDAEDDCVGIAASFLGDLGYLKADGSLDDGFEIVTHPMSYEWAMANFPWAMLTRLDEAGCHVTDRTGIHVHLSRAGFSSTCHTYRWMKFIYRNQPQVTTLARRTSSWARFVDNDRRAVKDYAKGARGADRYRAINTTNTDTFELRIFASSLDPGQVQAALAFAAASVEYTRDLTVDAIVQRHGWAWPAFVDWVAGRPAYRPLHQQMEALACVC